MSDQQVGPFDYFTNDHRACDKQWAEVEKAVDSGDEQAAQAAWTAFDKSMRRHLAMEEEVLFPAFERVTGMQGTGPTQVMRMEHQQMRSVLDQMAQCASSNDLEGLVDHGDTLLMLIQQHNAKEEGVLYPMADQHLQGEWAELSDKLKRYGES